VKRTVLDLYCCQGGATAGSLYTALQEPDDTEARRDLLDALGLLPTLRHVVHGLAGYAAGCRCRTCRKAHGTHQRYHANREVTP